MRLHEKINPVYVICESLKVFNSSWIIFLKNLILNSLKNYTHQTIFYEFTRKNYILRYWKRGKKENELPLSW